MNLIRFVSKLGYNRYERGFWSVAEQFGLEREPEWSPRYPHPLQDEITPGVVVVVAAVVVYVAWRVLR